MSSEVLVQLTRFEGSSPREAGAWMLVGASRVEGTIGGGHLEFQAIARVRAALANGELLDDEQRNALGPSLGQCCGGVVHLRYRSVPQIVCADEARALGKAHDERALLPVALFGGGHVGRALVDLLQFMPCTVRWIDSRDEIFPEQLPANVQAEHSDPVERAVTDLAAGSCVLIMSFSHAEDLQIVWAALKRQRDAADLPWIGLIGSKTKWASFRQRLLALGASDAELARVACPIGIAGIEGKEPHVVAASVVAQLMGLRSASVS